MCLRKREDVLADYLKTLARYNGLPACDELVEKDMLKKYDRQTMEDSLYALFYPVNSIVHEWDKAPEGYEQEDYEDEAPEEQEQAEGGGDALGETCYAGIVQLTDKWIACLQERLPESSRKLAVAILTAMSQVSCQLYACTFTKKYQADALTWALLQHSLNKCGLIRQCLASMLMDGGGARDFTERIQSVTVGLDDLDRLIREYLSKVLAPGGRS